MDEIELIREARPEAPPYPDAARAAARSALLSPSARETRAHRTHGRGLPAGLWGRHRFLTTSLTVTTGLAVAAAAVVVLNTGPNTAEQRRTPGFETINAAQLLNAAAATVETRPAPHPRPRQWAYTKEILYSEQPTSGQIGPDHADVRGGLDEPAKPYTWETWIQFDGTHTAGNSSGRLRVSRLHLDADETTPHEDYRYLTGLPTDPKALLDRLCSRRPPYDRSGSECAITMLDKYLRNVAVPPKLLATFYRLLATLPKIQVKKNAKDLAGRPALAFSVSDGYQPGLGHLRQAILIDPRTYEYRGQLETVIPPSTTSPRKRPGARPPGLPLGDHEEVLRASTQLSSGIVDQPGQRP